MDELVKLVMEKTNMPEDQARTAVQTVLDFLKQKLPAPIASQVDAAIQGGALGGLAQGLGGILGGGR